MVVRTRIAPSPTGSAHIGTAFVALVNYCYAKKNGGKFILRIEDTDRSRSTIEFENGILKALKWLGLEWDEFYRQSDRNVIYATHAQQLINNNHAFHCFCTSERLDALRAMQTASKMPPGYDGKCLHLSASDKQTLIDSGVPYVIRMNVPKTGSCVFEDSILGKIEFPYNQVDMQVLVKSDGYPTYHLANVVDDHLMEITNVIRGEDWVSSTPKHLLLYKYFGWEPPQFAHLPLLRNADRTKMSKRKNPTSILLYKSFGYLPKALLNFLGLLAVKTKEGIDEKFTLDEMIANFDLGNVNAGGPVFDKAKLEWLNARWLRETLTLEEYITEYTKWACGDSVQRIVPNIIEENVVPFNDRLGKLLSLAKDRATNFGEVGSLLSPFMINIPKYDINVFVPTNKLSLIQMQQILSKMMEEFDNLKFWTREDINTALRVNAEEMGFKMKEFTRPFYPAILGTPQGLPIFDAIEILGPDVCRERLRNAIGLLNLTNQLDVE